MNKTLVLIPLLAFLNNFSGRPATKTYSVLGNRGADNLKVHVMNPRGTGKVNIIRRSDGPGYE